MPTTEKDIMNRQPMGRFHDFTGTEYDEMKSIMGPEEFRRMYYCVPLPDDEAAIRWRIQKEQPLHRRMGCDPYQWIDF